MCQLPIYCLLALNLPLFTFLCDTGAGLCKLLCQLAECLFISRGHWSDCKVIEVGKHFTNARSPFLLLSLILQGPAKKRAPVVPTGMLSSSISSPSEGSSLLRPQNPVASTNYCQTKISNEFHRNWKAVCSCGCHAVFAKARISALAVVSPTSLFVFPTSSFFLLSLGGKLPFCTYYFQIPLK